MKFKKECVFVLAVFFLGIVFSICTVSAALGIVPAKMRIDFESNGKFLANFQAKGAEAEQNLYVFADGDFAEHVSFDKTSFKGQDSFTAYLTLPEKAEKPGKNKLYIKIAENISSSGGFGARLIVGGLIEIIVPYPGEYAEIKKFSIGEVNENEPVTYDLVVENLGSENLIISSRVLVYSEDKLIETHDLGHRLINTKGVDVFSKTVEKGYGDGSYSAEAIISYGSEEKNFSKGFKIGSLLVNVVNHTKEVLVGKINEFDIEVKSNWNNGIENVYAEVNISKNEIQADYFKTPSIHLYKQGSGILKGYFNTENVKTGKYKAKVRVFYNGQYNEEVVDVRVRSEKEINIVYVVGGIVILVLLIIIGILFWRSHKKK